MIFFVFMVHFGILKLGNAGTVGEVWRDDCVPTFHAVAMELVGPSSQELVPQLFIKLEGIIIHGKWS